MTVWLEPTQETPRAFRVFPVNSEEGMYRYPPDQKGMVWSDTGWTSTPATTKYTVSAARAEGAAIWSTSSMQHINAASRFFMTVPPLRIRLKQLLNSLFYHSFRRLVKRQPGTYGPMVTPV